MNRLLAIISVAFILLLLVVYSRPVTALTLDDLTHYFHDEDLLTLAVADQQIPVLEIQPSVPLVRGTAIILV